MKHQPRSYGLKWGGRLEPATDGFSNGRSRHFAAIPKVSAQQRCAEKLALGSAYKERGYVVCKEAGEPYHPSTLSRLWQAAISELDVPLIRLHDTRHTCATLVHLQGVPIALVAAWLGHADVSFTLRTCVHAQPEALAWPRAASRRRRRPPGIETVRSSVRGTCPWLVTISDKVGPHRTCVRSALALFPQLK